MSKKMPTFKAMKSVMMSILSRFCLVILCFSILTVLQGQVAEELLRTSFGNGYGLPKSKITHIAQDSAGYLWVGSNIGLHRFDGKEFKSYNSKDKKRAGLPRGEISGITISPWEQVYVSVVNEGLYILDKESDIFQRATSDSEIGINRYLDILPISESEIFLSDSKKGVFRLDIENDSVQPFLEQEDIFNLRLNSQKELLLFGKGIYKYNAADGTLESLESETWLEVNYQNESAAFGITTYDNQISYFDLESLTKSYLSNLSDKSLVYNSIAIRKDIVWIASSNGLRYYNLKSGEWASYFVNKPLNVSNASSEVFKVFIDRKGVVWFSQNDELHAIDPDNQLVKKIYGAQQNYYSVAVQINERIGLFLPYYSDEFHLINLENNDLEILPSYANNFGLSNPFDAKKIGDKIWIFYLNGVTLFDPETREVTHLSFGKFDEYFNERHKKKATLDKNGMLWLQDLSNHSIWKINPSTMEVDSIQLGNRIGQSRYPTIAIQNNGEIFVFIDEKLQKIDFKSQTLTELLPTSNSPNLQFVESLMVIDDEIWILNDGDLYKGTINGVEYNIETLYEHSYSSKMNCCNAFFVDKEGKKYIMSPNGLNLYLENENRFIEIGGEEGLSNLDQRTSVFIMGKYIFILNNGITKLKNSDFEKLNTDISVFIESFKNNGVDQNPTLYQEFGFKENDLSIEFNALNLTKAIHTQYKYRLDEDEDWITTSYNNNTAYFTDLSPGKYNFEVKAKGKFSDWSQSAVLSFKIHPPFWRTWWFLTTLAILSGGIIYYLIKRREKEILRISNLETKMAELENEALRAQMNPHFIFNSLNSIKAFIINNDRIAAADYLTNFSELIRTILANSREKEITLTKELEALQLYVDIENVRLEDKFTYNVHMPSSEDLGSILIPPLTLQPFVENSIWHGLIHKKEHGKLDILVSKEDNDLCIDIRDDGVGRKRSKVIEADRKRRRSYGILITKQRLENASNNGTLENQNIEITDLINDEGKAMGTNVRVRLPIQRKATHINHQIKKL